MKVAKQPWLFPFFLGLLATAPAGAHPVTYQGAVALMTWNSPMMSDYWLSYSVTPYFAVTGRYFSLRNEAGASGREFYLPQLNFLLHRWNERESQANLYLSGAYGLERKDRASSGAALTALEADWESRRYYVSGKYQLLRLTKTQPLDYARFRVGYAPYLAEFNDLHTWLMLQLERQPEFFGKAPQIAPVLRFFYQNILWEAGASTSGNWLFNFMMHF